MRCLVSQIPVVDGSENMRRVHGSVAYRELWQQILEDRLTRYDRPEDRAYIPHASATPGAVSYTHLDVYKRQAHRHLQHRVFR